MSYRHHAGARFEAEERGLVDELAAFPVQEGPIMDALVYADMTTGPAGQPMSLDQRVDEVLRRYPAGDPVHRAIVRAHLCGTQRGSATSQVNGCRRLR